MRFVHDARADFVAAKLQVMISVQATVRHQDDRAQEKPIGRLTLSCKT